MRGTEQRLADLKMELKNAGIEITTRRLRGLGVSRSGTRDNLLYQVERALAENPALDSIYAFSDFALNEEGYWLSDREGFSELERLLTQRGARLYLGSVRLAPPGALLAVAYASGGGFFD